MITSHHLLAYLVSWLKVRGGPRLEGREQVRSWTDKAMVRRREEGGAVRARMFHQPRHIIM